MDEIVLMRAQKKSYTMQAGGGLKINLNRVSFSNYHALFLLPNLEFYPHFTDQLLL